jgi:hypothetical protein
VTAADGAGPAGSAYLVRLGTGRASAAAAGPRADLLDRCAGAGLPVPAGSVLLDEVRRSNGTDLADLLGTLDPAEVVTLRSAFAAPGPLPSRTIQAIPGDDGPGLVAAVQAIWATGTAAAVRRTDVVLLTHVSGVQAGVAATEPGRDDVVSWRVVTPEARSLGRPDDVGRWAAAPLGPRDRPHRAVDRIPLPPWGMRLTRLLRAVRQVVGVDRWDVEWVDDGTRCWLLGVQPGFGEVGRDGLNRRPHGRVAGNTP